MTTVNQTERSAVTSENQLRGHILFWLIIITPLGFLFKFYSGAGQWWFNNYGAGLLYEIFWLLVVTFLLPRQKILTKSVIWVLAITGILEVLQLWHPKFLEQIRAYFWGRALIGTTFNWWDFPHYVIGCGLGWLLLKRLYRSSPKS